MGIKLNAQGLVQSQEKLGNLNKNKQTFYFYLAEFARLYLSDFFLSFYFTGQLEKQPSDISPGIP